MLWNLKHMAYVTKYFSQVILYYYQYDAMIDLFGIRKANKQVQWREKNKKEKVPLLQQKCNLAHFAENLQFYLQNKSPYVS